MQFYNYLARNINNCSNNFLGQRLPTDRELEDCEPFNNSLVNTLHKIESITYNGGTPRAQQLLDELIKELNNVNI